MTAVACYFLVAKRTHHPGADLAWCARAKAAVGEEWGARGKLAKALQAQPSEVTKTLEGDAAPVGLIFKMSIHLKIAPPASWFDPDVYPWVVAGCRVAYEFRDPAAVTASMGEWLRDAVASEENAKQKTLFKAVKIQILKAAEPLPPKFGEPSLGSGKTDEPTQKPTIGRGVRRGEKEKRGSDGVAAHRKPPGRD